MAAAEYDRWPWQAVWQRTEAPIILSWLGEGNGHRLLDLGAGTGSYLHRLDSAGFAGVGLDISAAMLAIAARRLRGTRATLTVGDARHLPFKAATFARILMTRVLSHIDDATAVFGEARRILAPGGNLVLSDVDPAHDYSHTELPFVGTKIRVATYKRSLDSLAEMARTYGGFSMSKHRIIRACDLLPPSQTRLLSSIDVCDNRPVAFIAEFSSGQA